MPPARIVSSSGLAGAVFGPEGVVSPYRYRLWRGFPWARGVGFVMLNPSTATHEADDPTIRRCAGFARAWGFERFEVANLFAYRATDPKELREATEPVGPENDDQILAMALGCDFVVCAWGNGGVLRGRGREVRHLLSAAGIGDVRALRLGKHGDPAHPLYLPGALRPTPWPKESSR